MRVSNEIICLGKFEFYIAFTRTRTRLHFISFAVVSFLLITSFLYFQLIGNRVNITTWCIFATPLWINRPGTNCCCFIAYTIFAYPYTNEKEMSWTIDNWSCYKCDANLWFVVLKAKSWQILVDNIRSHPPMRSQMCLRAHCST